MTYNDGEMWKVIAIARLCHEANREYCLSIGDDMQLAWEKSPVWQINSAISMVLAIRENPDMTPEMSHASWLREKMNDGWSYGTVKSATLKTHPCYVPYDELAEDQKLKDEIFTTIAKLMLRALN